MKRLRYGIVAVLAAVLTVLLSTLGGPNPPLVARASGETATLLAGQKTAVPLGSDVVIATHDVSRESIVLARWDPDEQTGFTLDVGSDDTGLTRLSLAIESDRETAFVAWGSKVASVDLEAPRVVRVLDLPISAPPRDSEPGERQISDIETLLDGNLAVAVGGETRLRIVSPDGTWSLGPETGLWITPLSSLTETAHGIVLTGTAVAGEARHSAVRLTDTASGVVRTFTPEVIAAGRDGMLVTERAGAAFAMTRAGDEVTITRAADDSRAPATVADDGGVWTWYYAKDGLHVAGLLSDGSVHDHLIPMARFDTQQHKYRPSGGGPSAQEALQGFISPAPQAIVIGTDGAAYLLTQYGQGGPYPAIQRVSS